MFERVPSVYGKTSPGHIHTTLIGYKNPVMNLTSKKEDYNFPFPFRHLLPSTKTSLNLPSTYLCMALGSMDIFFAWRFLTRMRLISICITHLKHYNTCCTLWIVRVTFAHSIHHLMPLLYNFICSLLPFLSSRIYNYCVLSKRGTLFNTILTSEVEPAFFHSIHSLYTSPWDHFSCLNVI